MWRVYIIKSKDHDWYYMGMSQNPFDRLKSHNSGKVRSTKYKKPYEILLIEEFDSLKKARTREKYYKTGFGKKVWMKKIKDNNGLGFPARSRPAGGPAGNP